MRLHYTPGSPFARMIRVLLRELQVSCDEVAIGGFPPPSDYFAVNPLGQVPVLETEDGIRFPTRLIIDHLLAWPRSIALPVAVSVRREPGSWQDEQTMTIVLAMGDAMVALKHQEWAGLELKGTNLLGYDPAARHAERVTSTLDWLEDRATSDGFIPRVLSAQDVAVSCLLLWADARGGFPWRGRPQLEAIVGGCAARPSFIATAPQPWP